MKDLIKEIEEIIVSLKRQYKNCFEEIGCPLFASDEIRAKILAYTDCLNVLNQYNIITAPKQIKLSEIVERLKDIFKDLCSITCERVSPIFTYIYCEDDVIVTIDKEKNIILNIEFTNTFIELKWLYTLWIAGSEIIDDLGE